MHGLMKGALITRLFYIFTDVILVGLSGSTLRHNAMKMEIKNTSTGKDPFFVFLDILGFKSLVENNEHETLVKIYKGLLDFVDRFNSKKREDENHRLELFKGDYNPIKIKLVCISDSIMLWTDYEDEAWAFRDILSAVRELMIYSFLLGIPLRGAIVRKKIEIFSHNESLSIVGKGLTHAYVLEGSQNWAGCIIDKDLLNTFDKEEIDNPLFQAVLNIKTVKTEVPFRGKSETHYCIDWTYQPELSEEIIVKSFSMYNKRINETEKIKSSIENKIKNTIEFYRKFKESKVANSK